MECIKKKYVNMSAVTDPIGLESLEIRDRLPKPSYGSPALPHGAITDP